MTELKVLQNKMNEMSKRTDWEVWHVLHDCELMLQNNADKKAVTAYLKIAVSCYGKERITAGIRNYGFETLKKYL